MALLRGCWPWAIVLQHMVTDETVCMTVRGEAEALKGVGYNSVQSIPGGLARPMAPSEVGKLKP